MISISKSPRYLAASSSSFQKTFTPTAKLGEMIADISLSLIVRCILVIWSSVKPVVPTTRLAPAFATLTIFSADADAIVKSITTSVLVFLITDTISAGSEMSISRCPNLFTSPTSSPMLTISNAATRSMSSAERILSINRVPILPHAPVTATCIMKVLR
ncbi:MAG: hypothetical protein C00003105_00519 [ANME-2 cluster archaeon HR1]|nr:MAG: hypothetical protein C00003105_00519 [ANME-2 cluster archaeon HR1]